ncbi:hypothetical protein JHK82_035672 [Glycine max]|uniref:RNase H type-1 domain-containing protein n=1 Tax=Glycine max TaxID=3847 RepID=A0A0R0GTW7_SOYBN|nr:hypothetical protein JHK85_036398 [Glycine max]KAG4976332.1 hypothetical protein JHK86_035806 [Glycine max]KAG5112403.1 hypothetical protein JHK82_035672 [Glycine max]KAH1100425.1 hypothetical protein GYH30_035542 [Glycine max]
MIAKFFWGGEPDMRKLHWLKWELLIESKLNGGLGFILITHPRTANVAEACALRTSSHQINDVQIGAITHVIWHIWFACNKHLFDNHFVGLQAVCVSITTDVKLSGDSSTGSKFSTTDDLATLQAFSVTCHARKNHKIIQVNRYPPLYGWVTCNTDNSAKGCPGRAGCGGFYRDRRAKFLGCLAFHLGTNWPMLWVA